MRKRGILVLTTLFLMALLNVPATRVVAAEPAPAVIDNERVKVFDTTESIAPMPDDFVAISGRSHHRHRPEESSRRTVGQ
jgi:hypothetical protein